MNTPPDSPEDTAPAAAPIENAHGSLQKERGRKKIRRDRSRLSRRVQARRRSADRYKRLQRMKMNHDHT